MPPKCPLTSGFSRTRAGPVPPPAVPLMTTPPALPGRCHRPLGLGDSLSALSGTLRIHGGYRLQPRSRSLPSDTIAPPVALRLTAPRFVGQSCVGHAATGASDNTTTLQQRARVAQAWNSASYGLRQRHTARCLAPFDSAARSRVDGNKAASIRSRPGKPAVARCRVSIPESVDHARRGPPGRFGAAFASGSITRP